MSDKIENKDKTSNNKENDPNQKNILIIHYKYHEFKKLIIS